jgi:hypothetical protein
MDQRSTVELTRSFAWGVRVWIDEGGVTRRSLLSRRAMKWEEIDDYRVQVRIRPGPLRGLGAFLSALSRNEPLSYSIELRSGERRLRIDPFFDDMPGVIGLVVARIGDRLLDRARAQLRQTGTARFGPLRLAAHALQWAEREPLPRQRVEAIDLLDTSPVSFRVLERHRVFPYGSANTKKIPIPHAALAIARELGYPVQDGDVVRVLDGTAGPAGGLDA